MTISNCLRSAYNGTGSVMQSAYSKWSSLPAWQKGAVALTGISTITALGLYYSNVRELDESFHEDALTEKINGCLDGINLVKHVFTKYVHTETGKGSMFPPEESITVDFPKMDLNDRTIESILGWIPKRVNELATTCINNGGFPDYTLNCESTGIQEGNLSLRFVCFGVDSLDIFSKILDPDSSI